MTRIGLFLSLFFQTILIILAAIVAGISTKLFVTKKIKGTQQ